MLYHCTEDYYKFLTTSQSARQANVNPFAASGEVISNLRGGLGSFPNTGGAVLYGSLGSGRGRESALILGHPRADAGHGNRQLRQYRFHIGLKIVALCGVILHLLVHGSSSITSARPEQPVHNGPKIPRRHGIIGQFAAQPF